MFLRVRSIASTVAFPRFLPRCRLLDRNSRWDGGFQISSASARALFPLHPSLPSWSGALALTCDFSSNFHRTSTGFHSTVSCFFCFLLLHMRNNRRHPSFLLRYTAIIIKCQLELIAGLSLRLGTERKQYSALVGTPMCMQSLCAVMVSKAARRPGVCWV